MPGVLALVFAVLSPLWMRVGTSRDCAPAFLYIFARHAGAPHYSWANVGKSGLSLGPLPRGGEKNRLQPRSYSPWVDMRPVMLECGKLRKTEKYHVQMIRDWSVPLTNSAFVLEFSMDATNVFRRLLRKGVGNALDFALVPEGTNGWWIVQDVDAAREARRLVDGLPPVKGRAPVRFPVCTTLSIDPNGLVPTVVEDEQRVMRMIGVNSISGQTPGFLRRFYGACELLTGLPHPDMEKLKKSVGNWIRRYGDADRAAKDAFFISIGDETCVPISHMTNCVICGAKVTDGPTLDKKDGERYYRTVRAHLDAATEGFRQVTAELETVCPGLPVGVNNGIDLVFNGNMAVSGLDWFQIYGTRALPYGWGEDWANYGRTKQINSIYWDAMRSACLTSQLPFGFYVILAHNGWEIQAKAYSAIGRGARSLYYFSYGPWYSTASDSQSHRPEVLKAMRNVNHSLGVVEDEVLAAHCALGDAAILLGMTGDIWMAKEDSEYGMERTAMSLLLRHCGVRTDVLGEEQVAVRLKDYPLLFVFDRNVRKDVAAAVLAWVERGGCLYLGPNAMSADEANNPLDIGFMRTAYEKAEKVGRPQFELVNRRELDSFEGMRVVIGSSKPYFSEVSKGRGRILSSGFFPGLDYWGVAKAQTNRFDMLEYPTVHQTFFKNRVLKGLVLRCETSNPRVEASLLEGRKADVVVFSNWTGAPCEVSYVVRTPKGTAMHRGRVKLEAGGFKVLKK